MPIRPASSPLAHSARRRAGCGVVIAASLTLASPAVAATTAAPATSTPSATTCETTFYVSNAGDDLAAGTTRTAPWKTLDRVNTEVLEPGTCVYLKGGSTFEGGLYVAPEDAGDASHRVVIGSYGRGRATISSGTDNGVFVYDTAGVTVRDLVVVGNGYDSNTASGLNFYNDLPGATSLSGLTVERVDVSYYGSTGIAIGAFSPDGSKSGFSDILIRSSSSHDNADAGIQSYGNYDPNATGYAHHGLTVRDVTTFNNLGRIDKGNNSGNGIVLGDVDGALIERSKAYNNGARNNWPGGGPVGIWAYDSNDVTIQYNESYDNKSGTVDGGGFDLDGGVTNSVMQYNYSHGNEGAGYLVFQFVGARPLTDNVVRYNISRDDGREGKYGGITIGSYGSPATNTDVYGNTIYMEPNATGSAAGIRVWEGSQNARFFNNSIHVTGGIPVVSIEQNTTTTFQGNNYFTSGSPFLALVGGAAFDDTDATSYSSLDAWRAATHAEELNGKKVGSTNAPRYVGNPAAPTTAAGFILRPSSKLIGAGLDLRRLGIDAGGHDYFGVPIPLHNRYSIGAAQL
jgi:Right handed beta helix region